MTVLMLMLILIALEERNDEGEFKIPDSIPKACHQHYELAMKYAVASPGAWQSLAFCIEHHSLKALLLAKNQEICDNTRNDPSAREDWEDNMLVGATAGCTAAGGLIGIRAGHVAAILGVAAGAATCGFYVSTNNDDWIEVHCDL